MKTRNNLLIWASIIGVPILSTAQTTINGNVTNSFGEPVPGAKILLAETYFGTITSFDGNFILSKIPEDTYTFIISASGFEKKDTSIQVSGSEMKINFQLTELTYTSDEIVVSATRAGDKTPTTYTNIGSAQIEKINYGQDLPYLFNLTPSTVVTSDAGAGVGYTGIRIRGVDPTRTNVTINGIPINDSESHGTFWVNMPDFASSVDNIQIQRGVGTSSNGAAAFGASINIKTNEVKRNPYAQISTSYGSFNTLKKTVEVGSGLISNKFTLDARLSRISSDGYIDRASSDLKSYYLSSAWLGKKSTIRATVFSGKEITYQAWYGTPHAVLFGNTDSLNFHYYNNLGFMYVDEQDSLNLYNSGRTYNYYTYDNEVDNYQQDHYQLHFLHEINSMLNFTAALHYTRGRGFYEQYRKNESLENYGLLPVTLGSDTVFSGDFIRRRWLDNHFYGAVFSMNYSNRKGFEMTFGGALNQYDGSHFGEIIWAEFASNSEISDRYYENDGLKTDGSAYLKATYELKKFTFFADVQYRHIDYSFFGPDQVNGEIVEIEQDVQYDFINPKVGLMYAFNNKSEAYASFAVANREPVRDDFVNSTSLSRPSHETLQNIETGYRLRLRKLMFNANFYWMNYQNQLVLTGAINDVGAYARTNVDNSYRAGIEMEAGYRILKNLSIAGNLSLSQNKVVSFTEYQDNYDTGIQTAIEHRNTDLAFSPNIIAAGAIEYLPFKNFSVNLIGKYVGRQYLDNTSNRYRSLNPFSLMNAEINYTIEGKLFHEIQVGLQLNNILNQLYENNGYTYSYIYGGQTITENFYYPQAGFHWMSRIQITF